MDDHRYSVGRTVVFRHPSSSTRSGRAAKVSGTVIEVSLEAERWVYTIVRQRTKERVRADEDDILYGAADKRRPARGLTDDAKRGEALAGMLDRMVSESALANFLRTTVSDLVRREQSDERARREGRELPLAEGDYIRVRGDLRPVLEEFHNYYGKVIDVLEPDIAGLEAAPGRGEPRTYRVLRKYQVFLDDGHLVEIYDPEVKLYYTAKGRSVILNWRAAAFLAEAFGDDPPYNVEFNYLEDHIFSRDELREIDVAQLAGLLASILYVKGHMGWRDYQDGHKRFAGLSQAYLVDSILAASRFDQRRNRPMTREEIEERQGQTRKLKKLLGH